MSETNDQPRPMIEKKYWRSLEDRADTPEMRELLKNEFPEWSDSPAGFNRRSFLSLMGASILMAGLAGCRRPEEKIVPYVSKPEEITPGNTQKYATSMPFGTENYSLLVTSHEGRPTKVAGNRLNPASLGSTNVWAQASILELYDPDRSRFVLNAGAESTSDAFVTAWEKLYREYVENGGEGLAVLTESFASPTLDRLLGTFRSTFPKARMAVYEPVSDDQGREGLKIATGTSHASIHDFRQADIVLSLGSDFLGTESRQYASARGFIDRRRMSSGKEPMNRLYLVENTLTQTTFMADHRQRIQARLMGAFAAALALELKSQGLAVGDIDLSRYADHSFDRQWLKEAAKDLMRNRGRSILLAGRGLPPTVHALVALLNGALGNVGSTLLFVSHPHAAISDTASLRELVQAMSGGKVKTLVILGGNPVYNAPADLEFRKALEEVRTTIHQSAHVDETSTLCTWHVPQHHYLESWGDVSSIDGHFAVIQPLIAPLFDGFSPVEMLALLQGGKSDKGYDIVRETWKDVLGGLDFEKKFRRVLHDGLHPNPVPAHGVSIDSSAVSRYLTENPLTVEASTRESLEVVFQPSPVQFDGRFANNGWLQEFPDPVTKITWDNVAVMSASTARDLGFENEDLIRLTLQGRDIGVPVWIMPGQADYSITLALGYGRSKAGRIGNGVGANAYLLRTSSEPYIGTGIKLERIRGKHRIACVQDHHGLDADALVREGIAERLPLIIRESTLEEYRNDPYFAREKLPAPLRSMWDDRTYDSGHQWGMSIDLNACIGCGVCTIACQSENNIPVVGKENVLNGREMHWIRIDRYFSGSVEDPEMLTQPVACMQCELAPCEQVCPVAATAHDEEGLNTMAYNRCIGTRYCSNNCPYKVRRFNFFNYTKEIPETVQMAQNPEVTVRFRGVMEKCTYCTQRIHIAKIVAKRENRELKDGEIVTACEEACPAGAIVFGDLRDPGSRVVRMKKQNRDYALLEELNIRPRTTYLAKIRNPNPALKEKS